MKRNYSLNRAGDKKTRLWFSLIIFCIVMCGGGVFAQAVPANDDCSGAVALTVNSNLSCENVTSGTTLGATASAGPDACFGDPDDDVWYSFTATSSIHIISLTNIQSVLGDEDDDDLYIELLSSTCGSLVNVDCSDYEMMEATGLTTGQTYFLRIYSYYDDSRQTFDICVGTIPPPPANDNCAGAIALTVNNDLSCGTVTSATTAGATASVGPDVCSGDPDDDVWFSFTATAATHIISLKNIQSVYGSLDDDDLYIEVLGGTCGTLANLDCSDPEINEVTGLTIGQTYFVRVYSYYDTWQNFDICVGTIPPPPANDDCSGAIALTVNADLSCTNIASGTTAGATASAVADTCDSGNPDDDVWFSFTATASSHVVSLLNIEGVYGSLYDQDLYVEILSGACGTLTNVACSDPETMDVTGLTIGQTYYVRVYSYYSNTRQNFDICVGTMPAPPANDDCSGAIALTVNPDLSCTSVTSGTTLGATASAGPDVCSGNPDDDVWFSFTAASDLHIISLINVESVFGDTNDDDLYIEVLSGSCGTLTNVDCSDPEVMEVTGLTAGTTYFVRVYSYFSNTRQNFDICIGTMPPPPANDACASAVVLMPGNDFETAAITVNNTSATNNAADPVPACDNSEFEDLGNDIWFTVQVPYSTVTFETRGNGDDMIEDTGLAVYSGTCGALVELGCNSDDGEGYFSLLTLEDLTPGQTLYVRVWGYEGEFGSFDLAAYYECDLTEPGGNEEQTLAPGETLADLEVDGDNLTWYTDEGLQDEVPATTVATDGTTYYVTQTVGECVSDALAIDVSIVDPCAGVTEPVGNEEQTLAPGETLADLIVNGDNLTWYTDEALQNEVPDTTVAQDGVTYYVTQTVGTCVSDALAIEVTIVDPCAGVDEPEGDDTQTFTEGETLADLDVTGENLTWYADEDLETELPETTELVDGATYYVTQTIGECVSEALDITVDEVLGTDNFDNASFRFWPNPATDVLNISYSKDITVVEVYNMLGQQVQMQTVNAGTAAINLAKLASGTYIVKVNVEDASKTIRIVKQ